MKFYIVTPCQAFKGLCNHIDRYTCHEKSILITKSNYPTTLEAVYIL